MGQRPQKQPGSIPRRSGAALWLALAFAPAVALAGEPPAPKVDFTRQIRPILAEHCWSCHGPDASARKGKLRLDRREEAIAREAIVPGDVEASTLLERIHAEDDTLRMPPPKAKKDLRDDQKRLLRDWIAQGAEFDEHWSFSPPRRPPLPEVADPHRARNPIDLFVLQRLDREGLTPSPEADRATLLRRVTLDLTGLPPTIEEQEAFLADTAPDAYERLVERLLTSPRHAERMAMAWLDAARYADTNGFNNDEDRAMWPWRDWVIDAFRRNLPYDQFIIDQLAGDLLPEPSLAQRIATGFHRNQVHNTEGGIIEEEYRVEYVADRVHTTATVFLGLSLQCARCHDHKYDPFSQKEYYRFFAFFNQLDERQASYAAKNPGAIEPLLKYATPEQQAQRDRLAARRQELESALAVRSRDCDADLAAWEPSAPPSAAAALSDLKLAAHLPLDGPGGGAVQDVLATAQPGRHAGEGKLDRTGGALGDAVALADGAYLDLGQRGSFDGGTPFSLSIWVRPEPGEPLQAVLSKMDESAAARGYDILLESGHIACHLIHRWPEDGLKVLTKAALTPGSWHHLLVTYDGSRKAAGVRVYLDGAPQELEVVKDALKGTIATDKPLHLGRRETSLPLRGALDDFRIFAANLAPEDAVALAAGRDPEPRGNLLAIAPAARTPEQAARVLRFYLEQADPTYQRLAAELAETARRAAELEEALTPAMVMRDMDKPRETFVLIRGQYDQQGEKVEPDVPAALPPLPSDAPRNRLGLARWLTDPAHPLTARVAVNRWWEMYFGTGLVKTSEDFGATGEPPSHPELLDWLATELIASGWDVRAIQRLIVTSATYRQSSRVTPDLLRQDPENRLLARGPRHRLPAESVRDNALAIAGLLRERLGGPSVKPYQPEGLWEDVSVERRARYVPDKGEGLYRRGMYTFWKRTCPPPALMTFDAPNREVCLVRRARTNTPLQALVLLNDPTYIEAARALAARVMTEDPSPEGRLTLAFRRATARPPRDDERTILLDIHRQALARFRADTAAAEKLLAVGDSPRDRSLDPAEHAAWTVTCSTILNLDEVISKR